MSKFGFKGTKESPYLPKHSEEVEIDEELTYEEATAKEAKSRIMWPNRMKELTLKRQHAWALKQCDGVMQAYAKCSHSEKWAGVFTCRKALKTVNECLNKYSSSEAFDEFEAWERRRIKQGIDKLKQQPNAATADDTTRAD